ncbi:regulatory protein RecX [Flavicella sp.]|uniref:regulatory protein RecX n=1 Tax=Flavicella sp. TaxID=2957742 RepID=UPI003018A1AC
MKSIKTYTLEEAKKALEYYCIYQDRSHKEVEGRLSKMRLIPEIIEIVISHLIAENFLNETRFSQSFARGKFRIKKWGKNRIVRELKFRNITDYNIKLALKEIGQTEYIETLDRLIQKKKETTKEDNPFKKKKKIIDYLLRQGFESQLIYDMVTYHFD